ncbi:hypothetical protein COT47_01065 [Candidatus Woesearchaeota archaeon CG08_land_8_20_14_0_20_43_7]|nr:MAG: hypothetical protein COT47_01065 [Candidatus Woesearchaeota archaeon CG08_land_8_20_14_0_20_43_7]
MRHQMMKKEAFSELYFEDPENLPTLIKTNESRNLTFTMTNRELGDMTYLLEITSPIINLTSPITLKKGEKRSFLIGFNPKEKFYNTVISQVSTTEDQLKITKNNTLGSAFIPMSFSTSIGDILHADMTAEELKNKPIGQSTFTKTQDDTSIHTSNTTSTLEADGDILTATTISEETELLAMKNPFSIRLYKPDSTNLEINFKFEIE